MKLFKYLFPLVDHLYIFQILEYRPLEFLRWFLAHPMERDLQRKHQLDLTVKACLLLVTSLLLMATAAVILANITIFATWSALLFIIILQVVSPLFLIVAQSLLYPAEVYHRQQIINAAQAKLGQLPSLKIIAIAGSYGKTSVKNILYTLLWKDFRVVKTPKSYNNPLSIAQTILEDVKDNTEILIAEVGAYQRGEIAKVVNWLKPQIGVITAIAPQHLERFGSVEKIAQAKFELVEKLPKDGLAILNGQSDWLGKLAPQAVCRVLFYGQAGNPIFATNVEVTTDHTSFLLHTSKGHALITIPLVGKHHVDNFLPAAAVVLSLGISLNQIRLKASKLLPTPHRLEIRQEGGLTIIDNSYNTNPESAKISFQLLQDYSGSSKIIITPGLIEQGSKSSEANRLFAKQAAHVADYIIIVGENARKDLLAGLEDAHYPKQKIILVKDLAEGMAQLNQLTKPKSVILIENDLPDSYF